MVKRINTTISTESVNFQAPKAAKTNQAWRYAGGQILRAPSTDINGRIYEDPKDPGQPRRKQESNFFLTINPNKAPEGDERIILNEAMKSCLSELSKDTYIAQYLKFGPKVLGNPRDSEDYRKDKYVDVIHSVDWKSGVESGPNLNRVHAHIWMTITHYSQVQINVQALQYLTRQEFNAAIRRLGAGSTRLEISDLPYVHVKLLPQSNWTDVMRQYIHKGMTAS